MLYLDTLLRGLVIGTSLMTGLVLLGQLRHRICRFLPLALTLSLSGFVLMAGPDAARFPPALQLALVAISGFLPGTVFWLARTLLLDDDDVHWGWIAFCLPVVPLCLMAHLDPQWIWLKMGWITSIYAIMLGMAVQSWRDDLVNQRRRFRILLLSVIALVSLCWAVSELIWGQADMPLWVGIVQMISATILLGAFGLWVLKANPGLIPMSPVPPPVPRPAQTPSLDDDWIAAKLASAMDAGVWRREGLTIRDLATELGVPEYRLRETINQRLGHRNFSAFINSYRIEAAQTTLADPDLTGQSILETAYAVGFASLGPFNRAFRQITGLTPSEFRHAALHPDH